MLWGYVITGAVGIVGTALGSWLTGRKQTSNLRLSISTENERAHKAEKRRVYVRHLAALTDLMTTSFKWHSAEKTGIEGEAKLAIALELGGKIAVARTTSFEVDLISTPEIRELAVSATTAIENYWPLGQGPHDFEKVRSQLIRAMRADLGEPPADGVT